MTECTHLDQVKNVKPHTHGLLREGCHSPKFCPAVKAFSVLTRLGELITSGLARYSGRTENSNSDCVNACLRQLGGRPTSPFTSLPKKIGRLSGPRVFVALRGIEHLAP